ncbi:MAG: sugar ABC transporter substrate-binding protein [Eubacteriales bacterium]|nr:sugar ABC transporter substrate-binding protein [Eubacteriales bacterium]
MKLRKRVLAVMLSTAVAAGCLAGAGSVTCMAAEGEKLTVGMSCINLTDAGLAAIKEGADKAAEDYNMELIWKACDGDLDTQIDVIRGFIQQDVDAIWIDSVDVDGIVSVVDEAADAGVIVLTAGSKVEGKENYNLIYPDLADAEFAARAVGEYYKDKEGTVGLIVGSAGNLVSEKRQEGFEKGMEAYPNLKLVTEQGMWDATTSMQKAEDLIRANSDLLHIHVIADGMSYGVYRAVANAGKEITMSSNDGESDALKHLEDGEYLLENLVGNGRLGYWGMVIARRLADGEEMATDQYLPTYKVPGEAIKPVIEAAGLEKGEDGYVYEIVSLEEAKQIGSQEGYVKEFNEDFVPTK